MRVARLHGIRDIRIEEAARPTPRSGECLVEVKAVTICGSDIHMYAEGSIGGLVVEKPFIPGHEFTGICRGGKNIPEGAMVVADPALSCEECDMCLRGWQHLCRKLLFAATPPMEGALCEYVCWPEAALFQAPVFLSFAEAALLEPLAVAVHAIELAPPPSDGYVAILGGGGIGLCVLQAVRAAGAKKILVTDLVPERLELALKLGADIAILADNDNPVAKAAEWTHGKGVDVIYETAGAVDTPAQAVEMARPKGSVALLGIPKEDVMSVSASAGRRRELSIVWVRRQNHNYPEAIRLVEEGLVALPPLLTHSFPLERAAEAFALAESKKDGALRVAISFSDGNTTANRS
jgi:L-iditol 2-dehydrogenase